MMLPPMLAAAVEAELETWSMEDLRRGAASLESRYRAGVSSGAPAFRDGADRAAYLAVRLPATFAAVARALAEVPQAEDVRSVLDLGAGPGTAAWAAAEAFPALGAVACIERDAAFAGLGRRLGAASDCAAVHGAEWIIGSIGTAAAPACDLAIMAYALNELGAGERAGAVQRAWSLARLGVVLVEPGTPAGFANILAAREGLLATGARIAAPCTHGAPCPMREGASWCHFPVRLARTRLHRQLKGGDLGYEDEKFGYLVAWRGGEPAPSAGRIVSAPTVSKGDVKLELCREGVIERDSVPRRDREGYRRARKAAWGDRWDGGAEK